MSQNKPRDGSMMRALRSTAIGAGLMAMLGIGLAGWGVAHYLGEADDRKRLVSQLNSLSLQVGSMNRDLIQAQDYHQRFDWWRDAGVIGTFSKTHAIDRFERIVRDSQVPVRSYALAGLRPVRHADDMPLITYSLGRHELVFEALPLHEEQLTGLLHALDRSLTGLAVVEGCAIDRQAALLTTAEVERGQVPRLRARCSINWYVFSDAQTNTPMAMDASAELVESR